MRRFYGQTLWMPQNFPPTNPDLHHGLLRDKTMKRRIVMQDAQNTAISNEYRSVPISILVESSTNPRKRFDDKNLEELAASMKAQGILAPLLVRELEESKYEVVAGARRLRAAKLAELELVPVRAVRLTDAESIEAQVVELSVVGKSFLC